MKAGKGNRAKAAGNLNRARWRLQEAKRTPGRGWFSGGPGRNNPRRTNSPKGRGNTSWFSQD